MKLVVLFAVVAAAAALPRRPFNPSPLPPPSNFKLFNPQPPIQKNCVYGEWTAWSVCEAECGATAFQSRTRPILSEGSGYGRKCSPMETEEWRECQGPPCVQDCSLGEWSSWGFCQPSNGKCGPGLRSRLRQIISQPSSGGLPCGPTQESESCFGQPCSVDCEMSAWSGWSECSAPCDEGRQARTRFVKVQPSSDGLQCGPKEEWRKCNNGPCARDCEYSAWQAWSPCPVCGEGVLRSRSRQITVNGVFGGVPCDFGGLTESEQCNIRPCAVDCKMAQWGAWSACSAACGDGRRARTRQILIQPQNGGLECGPQEEWEACNDKPCSVDCKMSQWSSWSQCSADCNGGQRSRTRFITVQPQNGGLQCGPVEDWEQCNTHQCPQDCEYSPWAQWSLCPVCGPAQRSRSRQITLIATGGGLQCDPSSLAESEACNNSPCPVDCAVSQWSAWSQCSADCNGGRRSRTRFVTTQPQYGGQQCGPVEDWEQCNTHPCPRDCEYSEWQQWSPCPVCGPPSSRSRSRAITVNGAFGGAQCDFAGLSETEQCNVVPCAVDCRMAPWSAWTLCSATCGQGRRSRTRGVLVQPQNGGQACGPREEWTNCNAGPCAKHCEVSNWSAWSACSAECGGGRQSRTRFVTSQPFSGGRQCPSLEDWRQCSNGPCRQPSVCDNVFGTRFIPAGPCSPEFTLCSNRQQFQKVCPGDFKFDAVSKACKHPSKISACFVQPANPTVFGYN